VPLSRRKAGVVRWIQGGWWPGFQVAD
jgi:hypothetical protein